MVPDASCQLAASCGHRTDTHLHSYTILCYEYVAQIVRDLVGQERRGDHVRQVQRHRKYGPRQS